MDEWILANGRVWTGSDSVEAVAVRSGVIVATGSSSDCIDRMPGGTPTVDVERRTVVPGLIDSHVHFVRAGLSWNDIVRWDDTGSLAEGLARIGRAAGAHPPGTWIRVLGGWHPHRFPENRRPTLGELDAVAPRHPVYVQLLYEDAMLNTAAMTAVNLAERMPVGGEVELGGDDRPTGVVRGAAAFADVLAHVPAATAPDRRASTVALMQDFNRLGVTGVIDPGGFGVTPETYAGLFDLWNGRELTLRVGLYLVPKTRGGEIDDVREWVRYVHPGFGDDYLKYVGMGEILCFGAHDMEGVTPYEMSRGARAELLEITRILAGARWPIHMHAIYDSTISAVLDVWEQVDGEVGLQGRMSLAHAEPIGAGNLARVKRLGAGIAVQDRMLFRSADSAAVWGDEVARSAPPVRDILDLGIPLGAGTDATVVAPHDPWQCIQWLVTGESADGAPPRDRAQRLTVAEALSAYTSGSAWFSVDEHRRGALKPGMLADMAVLDRDVFDVDPHDLTGTTAELTVVGGNVAHAGPSFAAIDP